MAWIAGCAVGGGPFPAPADPWILLPRLVGLTATGFLWRRRRCAPLLALAALMVLAAGAAAAAEAWRPTPLAGLADHRRGLAGPWRVRGRLLAAPEPTGEGALVRLAVQRVRVDGQWQPRSGRVEIAVAGAPPPAADPGLPAGTAVEAFLALRGDRPPANPGMMERDRLRVRGLDLRSRLKSLRQLRVRATAGRLAIWQERLRARIRRILEERIGGRDSAPAAAALILGERLRLTDGTLLMLARSGLLHLFAISGLHVGLAAGLAGGTARLLGASPRVVAAAALGGLLTLAAVVTPAPSVRRAALMGIALLIGRVLGRRHDTVRALAAAALTLAWLDPAAVHDPGFQLSVGATAGLVLGLAAGRRERADGIAAKVRGHALDILRASAVAQLTVVPLLALQGREIATAGLALNLAAIPLLAATLALLSLTVLADLAGIPGAGLAGNAASVLLHGLLSVAAAGAGWPTIVLPGMSIVLALSWWMGTASVLRCAGAARAAGVATLLGCGLLAARPAPAPDFPHLVALDVGQGDALLLRHRGDGLLVDGGGYPGLDFDVGAHLVVPVLRGLGVGPLTAVALSHAHVDHGGGLGAVLAQIGAHELWTGSHPVTARLARRLRAAAGSTTRQLAPRGPARRLLGDCRVSSLLPATSRLRAGAHEVDNDASLVLAVRCGRRAMLLTGDAGVGVETDWPLSALRGGVLKVGHHGSTTSTSPALLDALAPRHALISVGRGNVYGLPRDEVLRRLRDRAIAVYRTDRDGAVTIVLGPRVRVRGERWVAGRGR